MASKTNLVQVDEPGRLFCSSNFIACAGVTAVGKGVTTAVRSFRIAETTPERETRQTGQDIQPLPNPGAFN